MLSPMRENERASRSLRRLLTKWRADGSRQLVFFSSIGFLTVGPCVSAILGFAFWWLAARTLAPEVVGLAAAGLSALGLVAQISEFGIGALLMGDVTDETRYGDKFIASALIATTLLSLAGSVLWMLIAYFLQLRVGPVSWAWALGSVLGCVLTSTSIVVDGALTGMLRASHRMWREVAFAGFKLILLAIAVTQWGPSSSATLLIGCWVVGQIGALAFVLALSRPTAFPMPAPSLLFPHMSRVAGHHALTLASIAPAMALPLIVAEVLSTATNAPFSTAWLILQATLIPISAIGTAIYSVGSKNQADILVKLRIACAASFALASLISIGFFFMLNSVLALFDASYPILAGPSLKFIGFAAFQTAIGYLFLGIVRLQGRLWWGSRVLAIATAAKLIGAIAGGYWWSLEGLVAGWMIGGLVEAVLALPVIFQAAGFTNPLSSLIQREPRPQPAEQDARSN